MEQQELGHSFKACIKNCPKSDLPESIWHTICIKESRRARGQLWLFASVGMLSGAGLVFVAIDVSTQFSQSGFSEYVSLAFSDSSLIVSHVDSFLLSLADSLPVTGLLFSVVLILIIFISLRKVARRYTHQLQIA